MASAVWYRIVLSQDQVTAGHVRAIKRRFTEEIHAAGPATGACLFVTSHDARAARLQEDADDDVPDLADEIYVSPAAVSLVPDVIAQYGGTPCGPPERARAALLVGMPADWDLLPHPTH